MNIVVVLFLFFTLTNCTQRPPQPVQLRTLSAREYYLIALEKAQQWKPDAFLTNISVRVLSETDFERQPSMSFVFQSPSDDHNSLLIFFGEDADVLKEEISYREDPISVRYPINSEDWSLDSMNVLRIAQKNGGNEFLNKHDPETAVMSLYLERRPTGAHPKWRASYLDLGDSERVDIDIDPQTGEVIEVKWYPSR